MTQGLTPGLRYCQDATFAAVVNILESAMRSCYFTSTDLHEAVTLAAVFHERYRTRQAKAVEPACGCKQREEDELRARMNLQGLGLLSLQDKEKPVDE